MPAGRPRKPTALKILTGNPGRRPLNQSEPQPDGTAPKCPSWLDAEGKRTWKRLAPELHRLGLLTCVDGEALACLCQAWSELKQATETLKAEGRYVTLVTGGRQSHPAVSQQRTAMRTIKDFCSLFGLDPSSRSRLHVQPPEELDELKAFDEETG